MEKPPMNNVAVFLSKQAHAQPDGVAVLAPRPGRADAPIVYERRTFAELEAESSAVCHLFAAKGIQRGSRVLLLVRPGLDLIRIVFALFKMGAVPVTIDPGMGLRGVLRCVRQSSPDFVVGIPPAILISHLARKSFRSVRGRICIGASFRRQLSAEAAVGKNYPAVDSEKDELAAILFTSGSTGPAKGVCYAHGMFAAQVEAIREAFQITPGEIDLPMLPVFALFNPALGMTTVVPQMNPSRPARVDPRRIVRAIQQNQVTNSFGSPVLWKKIGCYCRENSIQLPSIKRLLVAGAPVPPAVMALLREVCPNGEIHSPYGATEALPVSAITAQTVLNETTEKQNAGAGTCVGHPLPGMTVAIIQPVEAPLHDWSEVREQPTGEIGEIVVRGPVVTTAYDQLDEATAAAKIQSANGVWHRMGDMGYLDTDGRLWFCGRKAERVFASDGVLYTDCIEAIFNQHPRVFRTALVGIGSDQSIPAIVVEPELAHWPRREIECATFAAELRELAVAHAATTGINRFFFHKRFPVDVRHNAKIHRRTLARIYQNQG